MAENYKCIFFFGSVEYDEWYFEDLEYTVEKIDELLKKKIRGLEKENDDLRTTITKQVGAITEMKDLLYMFADLRIFDYSSEIEEDMQELKKAYDGTLEDFLKYFKED